MSCTQNVAMFCRKNVEHLHYKALSIFLAKNVSMPDSFCVLENFINPCLATLLSKQLRRCSKLTTSLVNVSLNFQKLISQICQYFLLKKVRSFCIAKASLIFFNKNFSVLGYKVVKLLTS